MMYTTSSVKHSEHELWYSWCWYNFQAHRSFKANCFAGFMVPWVEMNTMSPHMDFVCLLIQPEGLCYPTNNVFSKSSNPSGIPPSVRDPTVSVSRRHFRCSSYLKPMFWDTSWCQWDKVCHILPEKFKFMLLAVMCKE